MIDTIKYPRLIKRTITVSNHDIVAGKIYFSFSGELPRIYSGKKIDFVYNGNLYTGIYRLSQNELFDDIHYIETEIVTEIPIDSIIETFDTFQATKDNELTTTQDIVENLVTEENQYSGLDSKVKLNRSGKPGLLNTEDKTKLKFGLLYVKNETPIALNDVFYELINLKVHDINIPYNIKLSSDDYILDADISFDSKENYVGLLFKTNYCSLIGEYEIEVKSTIYEYSNGEKFVKIYIRLPYTTIVRNFDFIFGTPSIESLIINDNELLSVNDLIIDTDQTTFIINKDLFTITNKSKVELTSKDEITNINKSITEISKEIFVYDDVNLGLITKSIDWFKQYIIDINNDITKLTLVVVDPEYKTSQKLTYIEINNKAENDCALLFELPNLDYVIDWRGNELTNLRAFKNYFITLAFIDTNKIIAKFEILNEENSDTLSQNYTSLVSTGAIEVGDSLPQGMDFETFIKKLILKTFYPTFTNPTSTLSLGGVGSSTESGTVTDISLSLAFNKGSINGLMIGGIWNAGAFQDYRSGDALNYVIDGENLLLVNTKSILNHQFIDGANSWDGIVNFSEGPQPFDSLDNIYQAPYAPNSLTKTKTVMGYRNLFYGTDAVNNIPYTDGDVIRQLPLDILNPVNGQTFTINIPVGAKMVVFAYPDTLRDVTTIKYVEGLNAEVKGIFEQTSVFVAGANGYAPIIYKVYTYVPLEAFGSTATYNVTI